MSSSLHDSLSFLFLTKQEWGTRVSRKEKHQSLKRCWCIKDVMSGKKISIPVFPSFCWSLSCMFLPLSFPPLLLLLHCHLLSFLSSIDPSFLSLFTSVTSSLIPVSTASDCEGLGSLLFVFSVPPSLQSCRRRTCDCCYSHDGWRK